MRRICCLLVCLLLIAGVSMCVTEEASARGLEAPVLTAPKNDSTVEAGESIKLKWNAVSGAKGYRYYIKQLVGEPDPYDDDEDEVRSWEGSRSSSYTSYTFSGSNVKAGYWYKFVLEAYDSSSSLWSNWCYVYVEKVTLDEPVVVSPEDEDIYPAGESITFDWNKVSGADGYNYYIKRLKGEPQRWNDKEAAYEEWNGSTSSSTTKYTLSGSKVKAGYWYKFVVEAYADDADSSWSEWVYCYVDEKKLEDVEIFAPENNSYQLAGSQIKVDWDAVSGADGYRCYLKRLAGEPDIYNDDEDAVEEWLEECGTTSYCYLPASEVIGGYWYKFVVEAYADDADSSWSNWVYCYVEEKELSAPVITVPANQSEQPAGGQIKVAWSTVSGADGYKCYMKRLAGEPDTSNDNEVAVEKWEKDCGTTSYCYLAADEVVGGYWYKFAVEAYADDADSSWSNWVYCYAPPKDISAPVITSPSSWTEQIEGGRIKVSWNAISGAEGYRCYMKRLTGEPDTSNDNEDAVKKWTKECGTTNYCYLDAGEVVAGYWYKFVVEAYANGAGSKWSNWVYVYVPEKGWLDATVITSPLRGTKYEAGEAIVFTWDKVANATSYKCYIKQLVGEPDYSDNEEAVNLWTHTTGTSGRRFVLSEENVQPNTWYKFVVESKASGYTSGWSDYTYIKIPDREDWIHYVLPSAMESIAAESFAGNKLLRTFDAEKSELATIESRAFANCTNLQSINLPESVSYIADDAFYNCPSLTIHCLSGSYAEKYADIHGFEKEVYGYGVVVEIVRLSETTWGIMSGGAAEKPITVTCSSNWTASSNASWLTLSAKSGANGAQVLIKASANTTGQPRDAVVTFKCGDSKAYVTVMQSPKTSSGGSSSSGSPGSSGTVVKPEVFGSLSGSDTITVTLGGSHQLEGSVSVKNGTLGIVSVSVSGGDNRALTHDYTSASTNYIDLSKQSYFKIDTSANANFGKVGTYTLAMYAKAANSDNAVLIGRKTLIVEEPKIAPKPEATVTLATTLVNNSGNGKVKLMVSTKCAERFYVQILNSAGVPINIYDQWVGTTTKRMYSKDDFAVSSMYTTSKRVWPAIAVDIPAGTAVGKYTVVVTPASGNLNDEVLGEKKRATVEAVDASVVSVKRQTAIAHAKSWLEEEWELPCDLKLHKNNGTVSKKTKVRGVPYSLCKWGYGGTGKVDYPFASYKKASSDFTDITFIAARGSTTGSDTNLDTVKHGADCTELVWSAWKAADSTVPWRDYWGSFSNQEIWYRTSDLSQALPGDALYIPSSKTSNGYSHFRLVIDVSDSTITVIEQTATDLNKLKTYAGNSYTMIGTMQKTYSISELKNYDVVRYLPLDK